MDIVRDLVAADGAHIRIESRMEAVFVQRIAFPSAQRLHDFGDLAVLILMSNATGRSTPFRLSFSPVSGATKSGAEHAAGSDVPQGDPENSL